MVMNDCVNPNHLITLIMVETFCQTLQLAANVQKHDCSRCCMLAHTFIVMQLSVFQILKLSGYILALGLPYMFILCKGLRM